MSSLELPDLVSRALTGRLDHDPVDATYLGDHERDGLLPDPSEAAAQSRAGELRSLLAELDALPTGPEGGDSDVGTDERVDAAVLRTALAAELFDLDELREPEWNPMLHNPGGGLHALLSRDFAPVAERLQATIRRIDAIPDYLAAARLRLREMTAVHADTARRQLGGTVRLLELAALTAEESAPQLAVDVADAAARAEQALADHERWLAGVAQQASRSPRIGAALFRDRLALTLDTALEPETLLRQAEAHLAAVEERLLDESGRLAGVGAPDRSTVREVLDRLAADAPDDDTVLRQCVDALAETTTFVKARELVTVFDDPVEVVAMPEIDRGVAVAYCRPNGPLETADIPTEMAVSPTPADWSPAEVASFYREYNTHMLHDLTVHEAMPGHALQLMHSNRQRARTPVRRLWPSGSFVEGWAVYAEELMADAGYRVDISAAAAAAVRIEQLKMQLRMTINAILDIRFHCDDLDEQAALQLMQQRGHQEHGEAVGKWRRVQLTSTQLCTYFVGYLETAEVAAELHRARPEATARLRHDAMLAHGSPPPRHLRSLLGLPAQPART